MPTDPAPIPADVREGALSPAQKLLESLASFLERGAKGPQYAELVVSALAAFAESVAAARVTSLQADLDMALVREALLAQSYAELQARTTTITVSNGTTNAPDPIPERSDAP